jgi:signal transduction histidine kinase
MQDVENVYQNAYNRTKCLEGLFIHDISNLFQIISNSIELCGTLLKDEVKMEDIMEYFQLITKQLTRGKNLIRNVRTLSDMEEDDMIFEPVEVFSELKKAIDFSQISFPGRRVKIKITSLYKNMYVKANELLRDVFENIIVNAIKYNGRKIAKIEIFVSKVIINSEKYVKVKILDNGIGIEDIRKKQIFQRTQCKRINSKGMGIGLSLVARLIEMYSGEIWVEDRIEGDHSKGSNFIILLPFEKKAGSC